MLKRQQRTVGAIVRVPIDEEYHTYAQILEEADYAFYDARTNGVLSIAEIVTRPVLFVVAVYNHAVNKGHWLKVGKAPIQPSLEKPIPKFIQDAWDPTHLQIYERGQSRPATRAECEGLERCAVWAAEAVEERLRDHYAGRPNKWVESLRLRNAV